MMTDALTFCARKMGLTTYDQTILKLRQGDPQAHEYFRYELARHICDYLGTLYRGLKAVYLIDGDHLKPLTAGVTMIAWAKPKASILVPVVERLDQEIVHQYKEMVAPIADGMHHFLNVHLVDDDDVAQRAGFGALLAAQHELPQKIWSR